MGKINLSHYTKALLKNLQSLKTKPPVEEASHISVSQTVSFFALVYEKVRNAVEYKESHLIRKSAIARILKRRLSLNPDGQGEAENLIRELLWARYFPNESLGVADVVKTQEIIDKYLKLKTLLVSKYYSFLFDLLICEIEELLSPYEARQQSLFTFYIYQVLKNKVKIENASEEQKNIAFYIALEKAFSKSDLSYLRFHLFTLSHKPISSISNEDLESLASKLPSVFQKIDQVIDTRQLERLKKFIQSQLPPFYILFEIIKKNGIEQTEKLIQDSQILQKEVVGVCSQKYQHTKDRLHILAIKAIIYIFVTKMIFALILEYPLSLLIYDEVNYAALIINSLFPPFLMFLIIAFTKIPDIQNTQRIFDRLIHVIDADRTFETDISIIIRKLKIKRPLLIFSFTIFYSFTFIITFTILYEVLTFLRFNFISQAVFLFFVCIVAFFSYRIVQIAKEYKLKEKESFFRPFADFFFMPILSVGKFLSTGIARLNFFGVLFDFFIEAPFKLIIEVVEEWISFVRSKREEII